MAKTAEKAAKTAPVLAKRRIKVSPLPGKRVGLIGSKLGMRFEGGDDADDGGGDGGDDDDDGGGDGGGGGDDDGADDDDAIFASQPTDSVIDAHNNLELACFCSRPRSTSF